MDTLIVLTLLLPLLLAVLHGPWAGRALSGWFAPLAPLPALALALIAPAGAALDLPWLLLGSRYALDETGRLFLGFTAGIWLLAGLYARGYLAGDPRRHGFGFFFLATQAGNLGLILAADAISFYSMFALMSFAAYGLVIHTGSAEALRAGRVYLVMALGGEMLLLTALWRLAHAASSLLLTDMARAASLDPASCALLAAGFGVKAGLPLLHMWLPLAHPVAPTPASAVLSGAMIKAGVLGWLRFLPLGAAPLPELGWTLTSLGLGAAFLGVLIGLVQRDAKTVLAYSSISQMGFITVAVGAGLGNPGAWPALAPAVAVYAAHHGLAKGALFLGVGLPAGRLKLAGMALAALALAGAPLTSGALAKAALKAPLPEALGLALAVAAIGTTLLMARLLWLIRIRGPAGKADARMALAWAGALAAVAAAPVWLPMSFPALPAPSLWSALWPVLSGLVLAGIAFPARMAGRAVSLPPGDILVWLEPATTRGWRGLLGTMARMDARPGQAGATGGNGRDTGA
ncbi:MAG: complex I subunit 5 family protein [Pseudomonadota bacterium]